MLNFNYPKKAQGAIGSTLTWVIATFLIVFAVILLIGVSYLLFKAKGSQENLQFTGDTVSREVMANSLISFLNSKDSKGISNKEVLIRYLDNPSEENKKLWQTLLDNYLTEMKSECSIFRAGFEGQMDKVIEVNVDKAVFSVTLTGSGQANVNKEPLFNDELVNVFLIDSANKLIKIKFYGGTCKII